MDQEMIKWIKETLQSVRDSIIERYENNTMHKKDQLTLTQMLAAIQDELEKNLSENANVMELKEELGNLQTALSGPIKDNIAEVKTAVEKAGRKLTEIEKVAYIANALQLDAQSIIPLLEQLKQKQDEIRQSFQQAVDIDYKLYGEVSDLTKQALESFHYALSADRQVIAVKPVISELVSEQNKDAETVVPDEPQPEQSENEKMPAQAEEKEDEQSPLPLDAQTEKREYLHILPMGRNRFIETCEFLRKHGARFDDSLDEPKWYMKEGQIPWHELLERRVEPTEDNRVYLHISGQNREQFSNTLAFLKAGGVRYDAKLQRWYVFPGKDGVDLDSIKPYLQQKDSVLGKLGRNKNVGEKIFSKDDTLNQKRENQSEAQR